MTEKPNMPAVQTKYDQRILTALPVNDREAIALYRSDVEFGNMSKEARVGLYHALNQACKFVGVKEPPSKEDQIMIVNFLCSRHRNFTIPELNQAVFLMVSGELGLQIDHYQLPTAQYWSKIIRSYEIYRARAIKKYHAEKNGRLEEEKTSEQRSSFKPDEAVIDCLLREYESFKRRDEENISPIAEFGARVCMHLCNNIGLFTDIEKNKLTPLQYLTKYFLSLRGDKESVKQTIENDVRNRRQSLGD